MLEHFAEILEPADVQVAQRLTALGGEADDSVMLAVALAVRALRAGSVCVDLRSVAAQVDLPDLPWPAPDAWLAAVGASPLLTAGPVLRLFDEQLYLDRYWREEQQVRDDVLTLVGTRPSGAVPDVSRLFPKIGRA